MNVKVTDLFINFLGPLLTELQAILEKIDDHYDLPFCIKPLILIAQNYPLVKPSINSAFSSQLTWNCFELVGI